MVFLDRYAARYHFAVPDAGYHCSRHQPRGRLDLCLCDIEPKQFWDVYRPLCPAQFLGYFAGPRRDRDGDPWHCRGPEPAPGGFYPVVHILLPVHISPALFIQSYATRTILSEAGFPGTDSRISALACRKISLPSCSYAAEGTSPRVLCFVCIAPA